MMVVVSVAIVVTIIAVDSNNHKTITAGTITPHVTSIVPCYSLCCMVLAYLLSIEHERPACAVRRRWGDLSAPRQLSVDLELQLHQQQGSTRLLSIIHSHRNTDGLTD